MEPIVFSLADAKTLGNGWSQNCKNVLYTSSPLAQEGQRYYSLSFDVSFQHESDYVTISSSMPYSYSRLMHNLAIFKQQAK